jgi:subtilisin family serine protease
MRHLLAGLGLAAALAVPAAAFTPTDPFVPRQWYLTANRTYDAWPEPPTLAPVRIAILDSGVDGGHPELTRHIVAAKSFVGGSPRVDLEGHGTFVAGLIAAEMNDAVGIAGSFPSAELLIAKIGTAQGTIPELAEAKAIRWAVDQHARVINMSLGGVRDPRHRARDTYSQIEADAIAYAVAHHVVIVAAVGNGDQAPEEPWPFASYPAALPHVIGVSAYGRDGEVPDFSNRDPILNDISAPGEGILSTFPRSLTHERPECAEQGYSSCGPEEYRLGNGTSFAAPQVTAAAAMLLALQPQLEPDQVSAILERSAVDATASNGCRQCSIGRDALTGWGRLDVAAAVAALSGPLPPPDSLEPNDGAGVHAATLWGRTRSIVATVDYWDDPVDVYRVPLRRNQKLYAVISAAKAPGAALELWAPGSDPLAGRADDGGRLTEARGNGPVQRLTSRATAGSGFYYLVVRSGPRRTAAYHLHLGKS